MSNRQSIKNITTIGERRRAEKPFMSHGILITSLHPGSYKTMFVDRGQYYPYAHFGVPAWIAFEGRRRNELPFWRWLAEFSCRPAWARFGWTKFEVTDVDGNERSPLK